MPAHKEHRYRVQVTWTGNRGEGTAGYRAYGRQHDIDIPGKAVIHASSDPAFLGDASLHNPEEMLVAALSSCHMLTYLHLCADNGIVVTGYEDRAIGTMVETAPGEAQFSSVLLEPTVTIRSGGDIEQAGKLHERAHELCFIARSVNFRVSHEPKIVTEE